MACFPGVYVKKKDEYGEPLPETVWMYQPVVHPTFHEWIRQNPALNPVGDLDLDVTPFLHPVYFIAYMICMSEQDEYLDGFPMYPAVYL